MMSEEKYDLFHDGIKPFFMKKLRRIRALAKVLSKKPTRDKRIDTLLVGRKLDRVKDKFVPSSSRPRLSAREIRKKYGLDGSIETREEKTSAALEKDGAKIFGKVDVPSDTDIDMSWLDDQERNFEERMAQFESEMKRLLSEKVGGIELE